MLGRYVCGSSSTYLQNRSTWLEGLDSRSDRRWHPDILNGTGQRVVAKTQQEFTGSSSSVSVNSSKPSFR